MKDLRTRTMAVKAFYLATIIGNLHPPQFWPLALLALRELAPNHGIADPHGFMERWVRRFEETGTVLPAAPLTHHALDDTLAQQCLDTLYAGYTYTATVEGQPVQRHRYFRSVRDAVKHSPFLAKVMRETGVSECTLLRALHRVCPGLRRRHLFRKLAHEVEVREERVKFCRLFLSWSHSKQREILLCTFWIDSKTFYICPGGEWVYAPPGVDLTVIDHRMPKSRYAVKKVNYYAVVNAVFGAVHFRYVSGTSDHHLDPNYKQYMVSAAPSLPHSPYDLV